MNTAFELLQQTTLELTSADPIKDRLVAAYLKYLEQLELSHLPAHLRQPFSDLVGRLTAVSPLTGEDAVTATVRKMSKEEATDCSREIVRLLMEIMAVDEQVQVKPKKKPASAPLWALEA